MDSLLSNLNPQQAEAVTLPRQSALILAGAGSGKTRVLTTRIAWLIHTGQVSPLNILAVTFTNKAAREVLTRVGAMLPTAPRGMWIGTFHGLSHRLLRAHYRDAGLPQTFQILDSGDQLTLIKRLLKTLNIDDEKYPPRMVANFVNSAKDAGLRAPEVETGDPISRKLAEIYAAYDEQCNREGVVDFAELMLRSHELLARNELLLKHYRNRFTHVLVDEFQDTNRLQYHWLKLLAGNDNAIFAVGDDDQCLAAGTRVTMASGTRKRIERIKAGDRILSCYGSLDFRPAEVKQVYKRSGGRALLTIHTRSGRRVTSTPEHTHFAGYALGETPQIYFTYLMFKRDVGYRLGTSQVYTRGQVKPMVGFKQRALQEHADELWVLATHSNENDARAEETILSLRYGLPTLPFVPRKGKAVNGLVHDASYISRVFSTIDTSAAAHKLLDEIKLDRVASHHRPRSRDSKRRNILVTLCGDRRGASPMHRICVIGNDDHGREALAELGLSVRAAKHSSRSWRFETCRKNFGELMQIAERARVALDGEIVCRANLNGRPLPFVRAGSIRAGMIMVDETGSVDVVERVEWEAPRRTTVYDLDVCPTHNFVAEGIVTHNSIYAFRGALARNMQDFAREFGVAKVIRLEQNYRSQSNILEAANALIRHNRARLGKNLWTEAGSGEPLKLYEALNDLEEADFVVDEVKALHREGLRLSEIALLYRSNAQSRVLEHALFSARVPYRVYGGLRFFERQEVKHTLAYLRLVADPNDEGAFLRVVNFPARGIGARTLEQLQDRAREKGVSLWQAALAKTGERGQDSKRGVEGFVRLIETMRSDCAGLPLPEMIGHVVEASGLRAFYQAERDGADRLANLDELVNAVTLYAAEPRDEGMDPLVAFIAHAALEAGEHEAPEGGDALQLMTVHAAKGLEFKTVFISGLEEGLFPHENSLSEPNGVEEERRLMYVALTRARERLYLSYAQSRMLHGQTRYGIASRFLLEIPGALVKRINVAAPTTPRFEPDFPKPQRLREPAAAGNGFRVGQNVLHPKFGAGVIVNYEGRGAQARVQVNFRDSGLKWLVLEYAKLSRV